MDIGLAIGLWFVAFLLGAIVALILVRGGKP
jgi:hypothetical protein